MLLKARNLAAEAVAALDEWHRNRRSFAVDGRCASQPVWEAAPVLPYAALDVAAEMLAARGVRFRRAEADGWIDGDGADAMIAWEVFCAMAAEPADAPFAREDSAEVLVGDHEDGDLLLHQSGLVGDRVYEVSFTRQFSFEVQGEYAGMNAFSLHVQVDAVPQQRVPTAQRWGYAGRRRPGVSDEQHPEMGRSWAGRLECWAPAVEASNSFRVFEQLPPTRFAFRQSDI